MLGALDRDFLTGPERCTTAMRQNLNAGEHAGTVMDEMTCSAVWVDAVGRGELESTTRIKLPNVGGRRWPRRERPLAPTGNIGGSKRQYRVAPTTTNTQQPEQHPVNAEVGLPPTSGCPRFTLPT